MFFSWWQYLKTFFANYLKSHAVVTSAPPPNAFPWTKATLIRGSLHWEC